MNEKFSKRKYLNSSLKFDGRKPTQTFFSSICNLIKMEGYTISITCTLQNKILVAVDQGDGRYPIMIFFYGYTPI